MTGVVYDKLTIINDCLLATGNKTCLDEDGSDEWIAASNAYDRALPLLIYKHNWPFQTALLELRRIGPSCLPGYTDVYAKPVDCLHLENVWRTDIAREMVVPIGFFSIGQGPRYAPQLDYQIVGDQIHAVAPAGLTARYVVAPGPTVSWSTGFVEALRRRIESYLYQGLNEDSDGAKLTDAKAEAELQDAKDRVDQELPRRTAFRSQFNRRRRFRKTGWLL